MKTKRIQYTIFCCIISVFLLISGSAFEGTHGAEIATQSSNTDTKVYVGGMPFGIRFSPGEVTVVRTNSFTSDGQSVSPADDAGILSNDIILSINGKKVSEIRDIIQTVRGSDGTPVSIVLKRGQKELQVSLTPKTCDDDHAFRLGVVLRDSSAGIGTVTFIQPDSMLFAGLGHGICDAVSGKVLQIRNGYISHVKINGICKGKAGVPGELRGILDSKKCGKLYANTEVGVFGIFTDGSTADALPISVGNMRDVSVGDAKIRCTLDENTVEEYTIKICEINHNLASKTKNFVIEVTDPRLLEKTGGIVQGMSGSPIIQDGKLVGAVTHVLINDPTKGYGIFIENMLMPMGNLAG